MSVTESIIDPKVMVADKAKSRLAWIVWSIAASFFFIQYIARVAPSVMAINLREAFNIDAFTLGSMSSFFYYPYVAMQVPVGMLIDTYGTKKLLLAAVLLATAGCAVFASASNIYIANIGRFMLGLGSSFGFISAIKLATYWFKPQQFGMLASLTQATGMFGAAFGALPIAIAVANFGWRASMWIIVGLFAVLFFLIAAIVRDRPESSTEETNIQTKPKNSLLKNLATVIKNPQSWINAVAIGALYAPIAAFAELWGPSYLHNVYNIPKNEAAAATSIIFIGWVLGSTFTGYLSDKIGRRLPIIIVSSILCLIILTTVLYVNLPINLLFTLLFLFGVANTGVGLCYAFAGEINPRKIAGTSVAFANMASVLVGALLQPIIGWLLDLNWDGQMLNNMRYYSAHNFKIAVISLVACLSVACVMPFFMKETFCKNVDDVSV